MKRWQFFSVNKFNNIFGIISTDEVLETWSQSQHHFCKSRSWRFQVSSSSQRQQVSVTSLLPWDFQYYKDMAW